VGLVWDDVCTEVCVCVYVSRYGWDGMGLGLGLGWVRYGPTVEGT
jgi:hypothetical protein